MRDQWGTSNVLKVSLQATIYSLHDRGWSRRRIARELGIDRETVGRYLLGTGKNLGVLTEIRLDGSLARKPNQEEICAGTS